MDRRSADASTDALTGSRPTRAGRAAAVGLAALAGLGAALLALDAWSAYADPETYRAVYRMGSDEAVYRSVGHYAAETGAFALGFAGVAGLAVAYARTGRWRRTAWGAAAVLAAVVAWRALTAGA